jgi:HAD superfamily hydrolase (TIGR01509 family)
VTALEAVVFDVDGTLVDSERDGHRVAFNLAFAEFGLPYEWGVEEYGGLLRTTGGQPRIDRYLVSQGVPEGERATLVPALHARKTEIMSSLVEEGKVGVRPGARRLLDELASVGTKLAVATTGSRGWVARLLDRLLPGVDFEVIVCGDEVAARKPDPEAFEVAVAKLGVGPAAIVAVEDSHEGLSAAVAAGLITAVVANDYTRDHDLAAAALVLDGFGEPGQPASVLADRVTSGCAGVLDLVTLDRLIGSAPR